MITKETVDEVLIRNDVESLIGSYVSLKRAGSNLKGLCPFHSEKTPSFVVYPSDNSFYCFGCGIGGNAITFIRQIEHLDYPDAVEFLAKRAGITVIRDDEKDYQQNRSISKDRLYKMNVDAAKFFHAMLFSQNPKAREALAYFTEKRGLSLATIKHFGLGFAPDGGYATLDYMTKLGYTKDELVEGFFASKSERGTYFDSFRNRVMFPIIDVSGNVIAFGGRVMDDSKPKYRNTMDTPVFKKSRNLFALNFAKQTCSESLILCEGYMDVIAMHAAGFTNAVATLGTAITAEQARLMSRYTKKVIISYDADEAGQKAAQKAMKMLGDVGLEVNVIKMPGAKDPDEYIKKHGKDKFREIIAGSKTKFEYNMESILSKYDLNVSQDKINAIIELEKIISWVNSKAERDVYIQSVSKIVGVSPQIIRDDVDKLFERKFAEQRKIADTKLKQQAAGFGDRTNLDYAKAPAVAIQEENVLGLLLLYPEHRKRVFTEQLLSSDDFFTELNRRVFDYTRLIYESPSDTNLDMNFYFSPDEVGRIVKMKTARMNLSDNGDEVLLESISLLKDAMKKKNAASATTFDALNDLINSMKNKT